ncbi:DNA polymerase [Synergistales bacterium]|nr:DNA polymerase [Synergistales bacterium]
MAHNLFIDLETFSSVDLKKSGMFKYIESPDFQILLFAYSLDGGPVQIVDLATRETLPPWLVIALDDPSYIKHAYNAMFELSCLSKFLGTLPFDQWRCTMVHGLYCGYTAGLEVTGKALGLPQDKQKLNSGKALIRYFCLPCKPTQTNGGRTRNYPHHDPERWRLFKEYCAQDVVSEMAIEQKLAAFPVPDVVQREWETDLRINSRGVAVDMNLVQAALEIGYETRTALIDEATRISGLENPNSVSQLTAWLEEEMGEEVQSINKETVTNLLNRKDNSDPVQRMLEIRQKLGKTSTKKYDAIEAAVCADGRVRGLLQFYGANRTGRWAGRLVQVQNLPRTYIEPLSLARELVITEQPDALRLIYGSVPDTLSQLIRTCFISAPGNVLIDADFSSIEARVISWLAGEQWRLEVFRTHGRIYEASASQMFGIPLEKIKKGNPEYSLRQKGKVAELALGYQGSAGALIKMGALDMGLLEEDLPDIVARWRGANRRICDLWYAMENAAVKVVAEGSSVGVGRVLLSREYDYNSGVDCMVILLPSGRKLYYVSPTIGTNRWGKPSITYKGMEQTTKRWGTVETYGGKLVENCVQAIARDCLSCAIERLESAGLPVVFHVHDEVVVDIDAASADLNAVVRLMREPMPWAADLPLDANGWTGEFFRKD